MFPQKNLDLDSDVNTNQLAQNAFQNLINEKLPQNKLEMEKLDEFAKVIDKTIRTVKETNENLEDKTRSQYKIEDEIWQSNLETYKKVDIVNISLFQKSYTQLHNIRNDYDIISKATIDYLNAVTEYFKSNNTLTWENLSVVLSNERQSYNLIVGYSKNLMDALKDLNDVKTNLQRNTASI